MDQLLETNRKRLLKQQTELRRMLARADSFDEGMALFFQQHASLHTAEITDPSLWSYEDALLNDMSEEQMRRVPVNGEHSVVWCLWHIGRIEDVAMNLLVADRSQVLYEDNWLVRLQAPIEDTGNALDEMAMMQFNAQIDIKALRAYRRAVGRRTREIGRHLQASDLKKKVEPGRIARVMQETAVDEEAYGIIEYWSKRTIAGLLLMPATRHSLIHLNEILKLKKKR